MKLNTATPPLIIDFRAGQASFLLDWKPCSFGAWPAQKILKEKASVEGVVKAGADSVCAISETVGTEDVSASVGEFERLIGLAKKGIVRN